MSGDMVVAGSSLTARQMKEFWKQASEGKISSDYFQQFLDRQLVRTENQVSAKKRGRQKEVVTEIPSIPVLPSDYLKNFHGCFIRFWEEQGQSLTNGEVEFPVCKFTGYDWSIVSPSGVTNQQSLDLHLGPKWKCCDDLNALVVGEEYLRAVDQSSVVLIRPSVEPDQDSRLSYNQAVAQEIPFISIGQRIRLDAFITWMHKHNKAKASKLKLPEHLDVIGWTRTCSLAPGGHVANAHWNPTHGKFRVNWSNRDNANPDDGVRRKFLTKEHRSGSFCVFKPTIDHSGNFLKLILEL